MSKADSAASSTVARRYVRTNVELDVQLVNQVKSIAHVKTTREAIQLALDHYARSRDYSGILSLYGKGGVAKGYDPKAAAPSS